MKTSQLLSEIYQKFPSHALEAAETGLQERDEGIQKECVRFLFPRKPESLIGVYTQLSDSAQKEVQNAYPFLKRYALAAIQQFGQPIAVSAAVLVIDCATTKEMDTIAGLLTTPDKSVAEKAARKLKGMLAEICRLANSGENLEMHLREVKDVIMKLETVRADWASGEVAELIINRWEEFLSVVRKAIALSESSPLYRYIDAEVRMNKKSANLLIALLKDPDSHVSMYAQAVIVQRKEPDFWASFVSLLPQIVGDQRPKLIALLRESGLLGRLPATSTTDVQSCEKFLAWLLNGMTQDKWETTLIQFSVSPFTNWKLASLHTAEKFDIAVAERLSETLTGSDSDPQVLLYAIGILKKRKKKGVGPLILSYLNSDNQSLRQVAMKVVAEEAYEALMTKFQYLDEATKTKVASVIRKIDDSFLQRLQNDLQSLDSAQRLRALKLISYAGIEDELHTVLLDMFKDADPQVKATAVKMVRFSMDPAAVRAFMRVFSDSDRRVRANAVEAVAASGETSMIDIIRTFAEDPDNRVRANAAVALWQLGDRPLAKSTILSMLANKVALMRLSGVWAVSQIPREEFAEGYAAIEHMSESDSDDAVKKRIKEVLSSADTVS